MLRIEMSGLTRAELRRLLTAAEARGQAELAEGFRAELAARAAGEDTGPPAPIAFEEDEPGPIAFEEDEPAPIAFGEDEPGPIIFEEDEPGPIVAPEEPPLLSPLPLELPDRRAPPARRWPVGLAAVALLAVGGASGWILSGAPGWPQPESPGEPPAPRAMTIRSAPGPVAASLPKASPEPPPPPASAAAEAPAPEPTTPPTAEPAPRVASITAPRPGPRRVDPCAQPPTPADRLLCNDLALNLLERELRDAYGRALSAGADPVAVRQSQAEWRRARDPTSDPRALAGLYDRRIRELKAMTAAASAAPEAAAPPLPDDRQRN